jgi:thiol-disulfide isomerase/thioredoxin
MKKFLAAIFLFTAFGATAQIQFEHMSLSEALVKAKKENKPIFVDVHAVWCGPCKRMAATAFVDAGVTELYNKNFINVKIDGEKADGPAVMQQYGITAFPTLLYINPDGTLFRKSVGMADAASLVKKGNEVLNPDATPVFQARKKYYASPLGLADLREYIGVLMQDQSDSLEVFTLAYYNTQKNLNMIDPLDFYAFYKHENDINSPNSKAFLDNPTGYGAQVYTGKIKEWINYAFSSAVEKGDFSIAEKAISQLYPYWEKAETLGQDQTSYIAYVKSQYEKYHP